MVGQLEQNIKNSFLKVKEDIELLQREIKLQKEVIIKQNEVIKQINERINEILNKLKTIEIKIPYKNIEIQDTIEEIPLNKQLNGRTDVKWTSKWTNIDKNEKYEEKDQLNNNKDVSIGNKGVKWTSGRLNEQILEEKAYQTIKVSIEGAFRSLSKQELKTFLTIYQLEDDGKSSNYEEISTNMGLSISCIRTHISNIMKKNGYIIKKRLNNNSIIFSIKRDFKALNIKNKLISMYYEKDPYQTTLFDIE